MVSNVIVTNKNDHLIEDLKFSRAQLESGRPRFVDLLRSNGINPLTDLVSANLSEANFNGADLRGADLRKANLRGASFTKADLTDADLRGADLRGATFSWAKLNRVKLWGARISKTSFPKPNEYGDPTMYGLGLVNQAYIALRGS